MFKIGDTVKIIADTVWHKYPIGSIKTITHINFRYACYEYYFIDNSINGNFCGDRDLELVKTTKRKTKEIKYDGGF